MDAVKSDKMQGNLQGVEWHAMSATYWAGEVGKSTAGEWNYRMVEEEGAVYSLATDGDFLYTASESRHIRVWKHPELLEKDSFKSRSGTVRALLPLANIVFSAHADRKIRIWQINSTSTVKLGSLPTLKDSVYNYFHGEKSKQHSDVISCLACNAKEGLLYSGSWDKSIKAWRLSDLTCVDSFAAHQGAVNALLVSQNDGFLFSASADGTIKVWRNVPREYSHTLTVTLRFQSSPVNALALGGDESLLYSASSDGTVSFWEKEQDCSGRLRHAGFLRGHEMPVLCLASRERWVFSGSEDGSIRIWRRERGLLLHSCLAVIAGHRGPVTCITVASDGDFVVYSGSLDRSVRAWLLSSSQLQVNEEQVQGHEQAQRNRCGVIPVLSPSWVQAKLNSLNSPTRSLHCKTPSDFCP